MLLRFFFVGFLFLVSACSSQPALQDSKGNVIHLSDYKGKWVVINFWAAWCKPCIDEMPELNSLYAAYKNKGVVVFGVNYDKAPLRELPKLISQVGAKFPILTSFPLDQYGIDDAQGLPMTLLFNPHGNLQEILWGDQTKEGLKKKMGL